MAHKHEPKPEVDVVDKMKNFWDVNNKVLTYAGIGVILLLGGYLAYKYLVLEPKIEKSNDVVFVTQKYFSDFVSAQDTTKALIAAKVLNGDGINPGALKIINNYSGTPAANLCQYYAGACYLSLGQFDKALTHLKKFDAGGATQIESRHYGMMGDAAAELKKNDEALNYYKKAANVNTKDDFTSSEFLFRAASFAYSVGNTKDAVKLFGEVKDKYPLSEKAGTAEKFLAELGDFSD